MYWMGASSNWAKCLQSESKRAGEHFPGPLLYVRLMGQIKQKFSLIFPFRRYNSIVRGLLKQVKKFLYFRISAQDCARLHTILCTPNNSNPSSAASLKIPSPVWFRRRQNLYRARNFFAYVRPRPSSRACGPAHTLSRSKGGTKVARLLIHKKCAAHR